MILDFNDIVLNNNNVVHFITLGIKLQEIEEKNKALNEQVEDLTISHEVEKMSREEMDKYIQLLEEDCKKIIKDRDDQIKFLKEEKHQQNIKLRYTIKQNALNEKKIKRNEKTQNFEG